MNGSNVPLVKFGVNKEENPKFDVLIVCVCDYVPGYKRSVKVDRTPTS